MQMQVIVLEYPKIQSVLAGSDNDKLLLENLKFSFWSPLTKICFKSETSSSKLIKEIDSRLSEVVSVYSDTLDGSLSSSSHISSWFSSCMRKQSKYLTIFLCFPARDKFSTSCKTFFKSSFGVMRICLSANNLWSNLFSSLNTRPKFPWPTILIMLKVLLRLLRPIGAFLLGEFSLDFLDLLLSGLLRFDKGWWWFLLEVWDFDCELWNRELRTESFWTNKSTGKVSADQSQTWILT